MNAITKSESIALTVQQPTGPMAAAIQALQAGMTVEQMQGLMGLQIDWEKNEARKSYVADMAVFKLNPPEILKTKLVAFSGTEYRHATLGDVTRAVVDALARHGFSHSWETAQDKGLITVTCKITHRLGHSESTKMEAQPDQSGKKNAIQAVASSITYMQRYTLLAATGLATMDMTDDDGQGGNDGRSIDYDSASTVATWKQRVDAAINLDALRVTRGLAGQEFVAANDVAAWNEIKAYVANKAAQLQGAAA